jgi:hypothetical protein
MAGGVLSVLRHRLFLVRKLVADHFAQALAQLDAPGLDPSRFIRHELTDLAGLMDADLRGYKDRVAAAQNKVAADAVEEAAEGQANVR